MSGLPFVSCLMPTCGRCPHLQHLIEEAVHSFAVQTYPLERRELVILNDCGVQEIVCDTPGVRIINTNDRAPTLGDKYNRLLALAKGPLVACWEDDDVSLPHRIEASVRMLGDHDYVNPRAYFFSNGDHFEHERGTGYAHNASLFRKDAALRVGGYPSDCRQDARMDSLLRINCRVAPGDPLAAPESWYVYCWSRGPHLSGNGNPEQAWADYGRKPHPPGTYRLNPHWRRDYVSLAAGAARREEARG